MLHCMRLPVFQEAYDKLEVKMSYPNFIVGFNLN